jgi:hypothetical protein
LFAPNTFSDADVGHYAESYADPGHLRALLEIYRAFPANETFNAAQRSAINVPLVLAPGENSPFKTHAQHRRSLAGSWVRKRQG